jgi:hypothetical protein
VLPIYGTVVAIAAILVSLTRKLMPVVALQMLLVAVVAAAFFVFSDNALRAAAALMALDEQVRLRRFLAFRVFWKLFRTTPALVRTQARSFVSFGPGWVIGDCLWPVICVVEKRSGNAAIQRSRDLMTGLRSAGRALAIRHLALAVLAIADVIKSIGYLWRTHQLDQPNVTITALWFPIFALFAAAPLFLYDRTANSESGPLLQLDRTPEVRVTARTFSVSSTIWLAAGAIYFVYEPVKVWIFGAR